MRQERISRMACLVLAVSIAGGAFSAAPRTRLLRPASPFSRHPAPSAFSSDPTPDPYQTLGVSRTASDAEIKKAFRAKAVSTHPDKNPELDREEAQQRFAAVGSAYEILKDPAKRKEYDTFGRVGGGIGGGGGPGGMEDIMREFMRRQAEMNRPPPPKPFPQREMEARIRADVASIHRASRSSGISEEKDAIRASFAGKEATIALVDPRDKSVKVRVLLIDDSGRARAAEVWYGAGAVWDPRTCKAGLRVQICSDVEQIERACREAGVSTDNDAIRATCAGKHGTVQEVDLGDGTAKVKVVTEPGKDGEKGKAAICWFPIAAFDPRA